MNMAQTDTNYVHGKLFIIYKINYKKIKYLTKNFVSSKNFPYDNDNKTCFFAYL